MDDVAFAGDVALLHQVGDVHRHGGPGDPRLVCQLLLGDQGVLFNPVQKLPLTPVSYTHLIQFKSAKLLVGDVELNFLHQPPL